MNTTEQNLTMKTKTPLRRSWLWRAGRFCLLGIVTLVTLYFLFRVEEDWRGRRAWEHYKEKMEAKGVVFDLQKLVPPRVPDDQNFAMTPLLKPIFDMYPPGTTNSTRWKDEDGKKQVESIQLEDSKLSQAIKYGPDPSGTDSYSPVPQSTNLEVPKRPNWQLGEQFSLPTWQNYYRESDLFSSWPEPHTPAEDVLKALSRYDAELAELQEASKRPHARFNIFYEEENPAEVLLPHLTILRSIAKVVQLRAVAELAAGQTDAAFKDVELLLTLSNSVESEPTLISHLVRLALLSLTEQTVWEGLATHAWSDEQLVTLQQQFSGIDLTTELKHAMKSERAFGTGMIELMIRKPQAVFAFSGSDALDVEVMSVKLIPKGWICFEAVNYNKLFDKYILPDNAASLNVAQIKQSTDQVISKLQNDSVFEAIWGHRFLTKELFPALGKVYLRSIQAEAFKDMMILAIALDRYHLQELTYPLTLDALEPGYLSGQIMDPVTQKPFHYDRIANDSFRLWSVGWDEQDDGGVVVTQSDKNRQPVAEEGDWVWPQIDGMKIRGRYEGSRTGRATGLMNP